MFTLTTHKDSVSAGSSYKQKKFKDAHLLNWDVISLLLEKYHISSTSSKEYNQRQSQVIFFKIWK